MADSLVNASTYEIRNIADIFAQSFQDAARGMGSSAGSDSGQKKKRKADEENLRAMKKSSNALMLFNKGINNAKDSLNRFGRQFSVIEGLDKATRNFKDNMKFGVEATYENAEAQAVFEAKMGTSIRELSELSAKSRLAIISMGGYAKTLEILNEKHFEYFKRTGEVTDATKVMFSALNLFTETGIKPSIDKFETEVQVRGKNIQSLKESADNLLALGVTYTEVQELLREISQDEDVRNRLRGAASEKERRGIIQSYLARVQEFRQLGMNVEQIKKANKALETISGKGPLERYKAAAKAQATLSAMGVEGAEEFAAFIRAGDRATDDQRARAREIGGDAQKALAASRRGAEGIEFAMHALADKGGLMEYIGKGGALDASLTSQVAVANKQLKGIETLATTTSGIADGLEKGVYGKELIQKAMENSALVKVIGGLTNVIAPGGIASAGGIGLIGALVALTASANQLYQAITLGRSDIHDAIVENVPHGEEISDAIGNSLSSALSIFSDQAADIYEKNKKDRQKEMNIVERYVDNLKTNIVFGPAGILKSSLETIKDTFPSKEENKKIMSSMAKENIDARNKENEAKREAERKVNQQATQQQNANKSVDNATMNTASNTQKLVDETSKVVRGIDDLNETIKGKKNNKGEVPFRTATPDIGETGLNG